MVKATARTAPTVCDLGDLGRHARSGAEARIGGVWGKSRMRTAAALGWWLCLGCLRPELPALPPSDVEVGTTILVFLEEGRPTDGWIHRGRTGSPVTFPAGQEAGLLELGPDPEALSLPLGRLRLDGPGRPLHPEMILRSLVRDSTTGVFTEADEERAAALAELRLPPFDHSSCLASGCLASGFDFPLCKATCEIEPPAAPDLPELAQPPGWVLDPDMTDRLLISRPVQPPLIECPATWAQLPGQAACTSLLVACPADGWPTEAVNAYVDPGAAPGGDGSRPRPYAGIDEALANIAAPTRLALAVGRHAVPATLPERLVLVGACSQTVLVGELVAQGQRLELRDLALESARSAVIVSSGAVGLERVLFIPPARSHNFALVIDGGSLSATTAVFQGTWGGVELRAGRLHLAKAAIDARGGPGIRQRGGQGVVAEVVLRAQTASSAWGLLVDGGELQAREVVIEGFADGGLRVAGRVEARGVIVRSNFASLGGSGFGIYLRGGELNLADSEISDHPAEGLKVVEGGRAELTTVRFVDNGSRAGVHGVTVDPTSELSGDDLVFSGASGVELSLEGTLASQAPLRFRDLVVLSVRASEEFEALAVGRTGPVEIERALVIGGGNGAVVWSGLGAATGADWTLVPRGRGLRIFDGAAVDLARIRVEGGTVPVSVASNNLNFASVGSLRDLEVLANVDTRTGLEVGRADVTLERYRLLGTGNNAEAVSLIQAPGRLEDGTPFGHLRARSGFVTGWNIGFSLASEAQVPETLAEVEVQNTANPLVVSTP